MSSDKWYECVSSEKALTQGDLILACPLVGWTEGNIDFSEEDVANALYDNVECIEIDAIVMTQACDLENGKVSNVVVCPATPLSEYRPSWKAERARLGKKSSNDSFINHCENLKKGFIWNLVLLDQLQGGDYSSEHRVVDFTGIFTVPRSFLAGFLRWKQEKRLRLLSPYREHLSQAFARFFMRVGLPSSISSIPSLSEKCESTSNSSFQVSR